MTGTARNEHTANKHNLASFLYKVSSQYI